MYEVLPIKEKPPPVVTCPMSSHGLGPDPLTPKERAIKNKQNDYYFFF